MQIKSYDLSDGIVQECLALLNAQNYTGLDALFVDLENGKFENDRVLTAEECEMMYSVFERLADDERSLEYAALNELFDEVRSPEFSIILSKRDICSYSISLPVKIAGSAALIVLRDGT